MAKTKLLYQCNECGAQFPKWSGQCADCGSWNSMQETIVAANIAKLKTPSSYAGKLGGQSNITNLQNVTLDIEARLSTGLTELDRVLGGGLVAGSVILIGGGPGIGKSTLLLQVLSIVAQQSNCLYVTGEESLKQVGIRATRLGLKKENINCLGETQIECIIQLLQEKHPNLVVIDSVQTMFTEQLQSAPGSVAQVREVTAVLTRFAKLTQTIVLLVGHVTKDGGLAGPRVMEHMVDTVLYFEGDGAGRYRVIRAIKNRFGAVNEIGVFAMTSKGLKEVINPSSIFLSGTKNRAGCMVLVTREGTRPLLVEVQALVNKSPQMNPKRICVGFEFNRLAMLLAVLQRHGGIPLYDHEVFINIVGGIRITETASDLAILLAIVSSFKNYSLTGDLIIFGEVGLAGEIRPVFNGEERLREAKKHGFKQAIIPKANEPKKSMDDLKICAVSSVQEAISYIN